MLPSWPEDGPPRLWMAAGIGRGYSSPIVADETVYITGDEADDLIISAFSLDGKLRWRAKNGAAWKRSFPGARSSCTYDGGKLYHMNAHGRLVCLDAKTGSELWVVNVLERFEGKNITWGISESLLILEDLVYATPCGDEGLVVALNKHSGDTVWATPALADERPSYASPILISAGGQNAADQQRHQKRVCRRCQDGRAVLASVAARPQEHRLHDSRPGAQRTRVHQRQSWIRSDLRRPPGWIAGGEDLEQRTDHQPWKYGVLDGQVYGASSRGRGSRLDRGGCRNRLVSPRRQNWRAVH